MKYSQVAVFGLLGAAIAQPHRHQHKRAIITATIWETISAPDVVVYVDENGNTVSSGGGLTPPTPAPQPAAPPAQAPAPAPPAPSPAPVAPKPEAAKPAPPANQPPPAPAPAPVDAKVNNVDTSAASQVPEGYGITWTGYKGSEDSSACKTAEDADREWSQLGAFSIVRLYGTDCDQPSIALSLAKKYNKKVFLGVYDLSPFAIPGQIRTIVDAANENGGWASVDTIAIGNEDVNRGDKSPGQVIAAVNQARSLLRPAGYGGPIVHVDTQNAILAHPELCGHVAGDYIAANIHAFFNPNTPANQAGDFVAGQVDALRQCGATSWKRRNVRVRVTETGWPKAGEANGLAVPGKSFQQAAIASIKSKLSNDVFLFSAFNNYWMKNGPGTFNAEHYWGTLDN